jgi:hypothetical protein
MARRFVKIKKWKKILDISLNNDFRFKSCEMWKDGVFNQKSIKEVPYEKIVIFCKSVHSSVFGFRYPSGYFGPTEVRWYIGDGPGRRTGYAGS